MEAFPPFPYFDIQILYQANCEGADGSLVED
jgi:hypothetical protein